MDFLKSKKVKALILGMIAMILGDVLGLDEHTVNSILGLFATYLVAQGATDIGKGKKEAEKK